jgi:HSP20 family protein
MSVIRWTPRPASPDALVGRELNRLFDDLFTSPMLRSEWSSATMPVDVEETAEAYVFRADLPGMQTKDVKVTLEGDTLTLRGERQRDEKKENGGTYRVERSYGAFERRFKFHTPVRGDQVKASYKDGVLEVRVPKADEARARDIEVQGS